MARDSADANRSIVLLVSTRTVATGVKPPQQERSRKALQKVLAAAEHVLVTDGADDFTMAAVAEQAGVSIGAIYRRFDGKDQLLAAVKDRLLTAVEDELRSRLALAEPSLPGVVDAFVSALADRLGGSAIIFPDLLAPKQAEMVDRGRSALAMTTQMFESAMEPYIGDVRRPSARSAVQIVSHTVVGASIHRAASERMFPTDQTWSEYAQEMSAMMVAYLREPDDGETKG